jgi:hypothetical protein
MMKETPRTMARIFGSSFGATKIRLPVPQDPFSLKFPNNNNNNNNSVALVRERTISNERPPLVS